MQGYREGSLVLPGAAHHDALLAVPLAAVFECPSRDRVRVVSLRHL